jgi:hypothetical protein
MRWSRFVYCAGLTFLTTYLVTLGVSPWLTFPMGAFAAYWTVLCTRALWIEGSFRVEVWRGHLTKPREIPDFTANTPLTTRWWWLANPKLDGLTNAVTGLAVLVFPLVLWLPLILFLLRA